MHEVIATFDVSRLILVAILYVATGLGILNTIFMSVMERTREFGILMAMGMRPCSVRRLVLLETLFLGVSRTPLGVAVGLLLTLYMQAVGIDLSSVDHPGHLRRRHHPAAAARDLRRGQRHRPGLCC